eukprot:SAG31_NODE_197_length_20660_cov_8.861368_1_plen_161_part_00
MLHRSMTAPVAAAHRQADVFANAHNLVSSELNGISVNSGEFWKVWADAGGNVDAYIKDTLPTYGLIGALALSKQLSMTTDPPDALPEKSAMMIMYAGKVDGLVAAILDRAKLFCFTCRLTHFRAPVSSLDALKLDVVFAHHHLHGGQDAVQLLHMPRDSC